MDASPMVFKTAVRPARVKVIESRITRLANTPEIAQAMLWHQQAGAGGAARKRIVEARSAWSRWHLSGSRNRTS